MYVDSFYVDLHDCMYMYVQKCYSICNKYKKGIHVFI